MVLTRNIRLYSKSSESDSDLFIRPNGIDVGHDSTEADSLNKKTNQTGDGIAVLLDSQPLIDSCIHWLYFQIFLSVTMSNLSTRTLRVTVPHAIRSKIVSGGQPARHEKIKTILVDLFRNERIEGPLRTHDETRQYAERLIEMAKKYGDRHVGTMQMMDYWIKEKDLIHKVFKVFVPRYEKSFGPYTNSYRLPMKYGEFKFPNLPRQNIVLEMKGNPYPRIIPDPRNYSNSLTNILLNHAREEYRAEKNKDKTK